jgi:threonine dehydratase
VDGHIRKTPTMSINGSDLGLKIDLWVKLEYLQVSGSFKGRGATHFVRTTPLGPSGVVAASGGNHGAAVAYAARAAGVSANIFVPTISSPAKVAKLREYGATVHQTGSVYAEAQEAATDFVSSNGGSIAHPFNDPVVLAGAGTLGLELDQQVNDLDEVIVACGGGGLAAGVAAWYGSRARVICCETEGTASFAAATAAGEPVSVEISGLAADALGATAVGSVPFEILKSNNAASVVVDDDSVAAAKTLLWERLNIVAEPSACVPLAALITGAWVPEGKVGLVICGANTTLS